MGPVSPFPSVAGLQALASAHLGPASDAPPPFLKEIYKYLFVYFGEGNGNLAPYSCLENPTGSLEGYGRWGCKESDMTEVT